MLYNSSPDSPKQLGINWGQDPDDTQNAIGESKSVDLAVFDSLGAPVNVRMTFTLESKTNTETIYRWYADSSDNQPEDGQAIATGTGILRFDQHGSLIASSNATVSVQRTQVASVSPMDFSFDMNLDALAALATNQPEVTQTYQDGAGAGTLFDYSIISDGTIIGYFDSGFDRPIGQIPLATFRNQEGLYKSGDNLYQQSANSGQPNIRTAGTSGSGTIKSRTLELSNTDIGQEIVDMILSSNMYRANAKVMTTSNDMFDTLMMIR
jgi:flagellar hook protein FlgE